MATTVSDPLVGVLLDGRYRVDRRLARGGMATVYQALDTRLERTVAVKVMHPGLAEDHAFVDRFIREARAAARLSHPNVVAVYDQGTDSGHVFLAMEYVDGRTLRDLLTERGQLSPREAFAVVEPVLAALEGAHRAGLVHRDIKPENVLIAADGRVKVADFGLARAISSSNSTSTGTLIGTVAYLSPEQVQRGVADARSDVYATGILLFELLTGARPVTGDTPIQIAYQHVNSDIAPPSSLRESIPAQLDALVVRATRRDPDDRPAGAGAMLAEAARVRRGLTDAELDCHDPGWEATVASSTAPPARAPAATLVVPRDGSDPSVGADPPPPGSGAEARQPEASAFPRRRRRGLFALAAVLVVALLVGAGGWMLAGTRYVDTPSLLGLERAAATSKAAEAGLAVEFDPQRQFHETVPAGEIISTDPAPGDRISDGATITAVLSKGPERYTVPDLSGMTEREAERALRELNLTVGDPVREFSDEVAEGQVIRAEPGSGTDLRRNAVVNLVLSKGTEPVRLPDVVGRAFDDAQDLLSRLGFSVASSREFDDETPEGVVLDQNPGADDDAERGERVELVVSAGPEQEEQPTASTVPGVVGLDVDEAEERLEDAGFKVKVRDFPGPFGGDRVIAQSPPAGTQAPEDTKVTISTF